MDYQDLVAKYDCTAAQNVFFYFDPPYMMHTRSSKRKLYKHDWSDIDHIKFLTTALAVNSNCMNLITHVNSILTHSGHGVQQHSNQ